MAKRRSRSDRTRAGADDWTWSASSEPDYTFELPRAHEGVLPEPPRARVSRLPDGGPPGLPALWAPATHPTHTPDVEEARRKPPRASVGLPVTVPRPPARQSKRQALLSAFRPQASPVSTPCKQRQTRKEVIFASGVGGVRRSAPGPYRRTNLSNYSCKG